MAETKYTRTYTLDCPSEFIEVLNTTGGLSEDLIQIVGGAVAGDLDFWFEDVLPGPDVIAFDAFLASFTCSGADQVDGESSSFNAKNVSGVVLNIGDPVYSQGVDGNGIIQVDLAEADDPTKMPAFGLVVSAPIPIGGEGTVALEGLVTGINTSSFAVEDELWVAIGGGLTATKPTGNANLIQKVAQVQEVDATTGQLLVIGAGRTNDIPNIQSGRVWKGNGSDVATQTLLDVSALEDVDLTGLTLSDILQWNGANFVPARPEDLDVDQDNIIYVGKHGNDTKDGRTIDKAVLTFQQAVDLAAAESPTVTDKWAVVCLDGGRYAEDVAVADPYIVIFASAAHLDGNLTIVSDVAIYIEHICAGVPTGGGNAIEMVGGGTGTAWCSLKLLEVGDTANGIVNNTASGILNVEAEFYRQTGTGTIGVVNSATTHVDIQDWDITGTNTLVLCRVRLFHRRHNRGLASLLLLFRQY